MWAREASPPMLIDQASIPRRRKALYSNALRRCMWVLPPLRCVPSSGERSSNRHAAMAPRKERPLMLGVSRRQGPESQLHPHTVIHAYEELEMLGVLRTKPGEGTLVGLGPARYRRSDGGPVIGTRQRGTPQMV